MNEYHFSREMAKRYGTDEAIMLSNLAFWVETNTANRRNIRDGRVWTYNSQSAFADLFDWWSRRQIQRILRSLEDQGAIIKGNYNTKPMDRTCWYTVSDEVLEHYRIPLPPAGLESREMDETVLCIDPNGAMDSTEPCHPLTQTVPPIPDRKPDRKPDKTMSAREADGAGVDQNRQFELFWSRYPRKEGKKKAREKWKRLNPDPVLFARIMAGLDKHIHSEQWRRGVIPHPTTWLNGERWEDELPTGDRGGPEPPRRIDPGEGYRYV